MFLGGHRRRPAQYGHGDNTVDLMSKKLSADLRNSVRQINNVPYLSNEWFSMVDTLAHISNIAQMEQQQPKRGGCLWDRDEYTVRFVIEEGKLNLCLRMLVEHTERRRNTAACQQLISHKASEKNWPQEKVWQSTNRFEQSMGQLLLHCFKNVETFQTLDMQVLAEHCAAVLSHANSTQLLKTVPPEVAAVMQELLSLNYLQLLGTHLESLNEDVIVNVLAQHGVVAHVIDLLFESHQHMDKASQQRGCQFLSAVFNAENFSNHRNRIIPTSQLNERLVAFKDLLLQESVKDYKQRKAVQYLLDEIQRLERQGFCAADPADLPPLPQPSLMSPNPARCGSDAVDHPLRRSSENKRAAEGNPCTPPRRPSGCHDHSAPTESQLRPLDMAAQREKEIPLASPATPSTLASPSSLVSPSQPRERTLKERFKFW